MRKRGRKPRIIVVSCPFFCYFIVQVQNVSSPLHIFVVLPTPPFWLAMAMICVFKIITSFLGMKKGRM